MMLNDSGFLAATSPGDEQKEILEKSVALLWAILAPIIFLAGMTGNILCLCVLRKMHFWKKPALFYLAPLAVTDMVVLCAGLSRYWTRYVFHYDLRTVSGAGCKLNLFVIYISMQYSSWMLVCFTAERFLKTRFPLRYIRYFTVKRQCVSVCAIFIILVLVDGHYFFTNGIILSGNNSSECGSLSASIFRFEEEIFTYIDLSILCIIPATAMIVFNVFIVKALRNSENFRRVSVYQTNAITPRSNRNYSRSVTRMVLFANSYFLLCTLPISLYFIFDTYTADWEGVRDARKDVAWTVLYLLQFTNYSANFFIYSFVNERFRKQLKEMLVRNTSRTGIPTTEVHSSSIELHTDHDLTFLQRSISSNLSV